MSRSSGELLVAPTIVSAAYTLKASDNEIIADATGNQAPTNVAVSALATGGTFAAGDYYWGVTAVVGGVETVALNSNANTTIAANGRATITWSAVTGATNYKIYRCPFNYSNPMANALNLVTTVGAVTTYTDTGTATSATSPPTSNGAAFSITLLDATTVKTGKVYRFTAITNNENLVTLAPVSSQKIDGATNLALGSVNTAKYKSVALVSDGANWRSIWAVPPPINYSHYVNVYTTSCPASVNTPLVVMPCPALIPGQHMSFQVSAQVDASAGATELAPSINVCTSAGTVVGTTDAADPNFAFWYDQAFAPGEWRVFAAGWTYNPRFGDINVWNSSGGNPSSLYIGFHMQPVGAAVSCTAGSFSVAWGAIPQIYWPNP